MVQVQTPPDKLAYAVTLPSWAAVNRVIKEFKKKRHAAFYLEIEEMDYWCYQVRVYKRSG